MARRKSVRPSTSRLKQVQRLIELGLIGYGGGKLTQQGISAATRAMSRMNTGSSTKQQIKSKPGNASQKSDRTAKTQVGDPQIHQDYRRTAVQYGKPASAAKRAKKMAKTNQTKSVLSLYDYGSWNRGRGQFGIASAQPGAAGTEYRAPVHLYDLTCVPQGAVGAPTTLKYPTTFYELFFTNETDSATVRWYGKRDSLNPGRITTLVSNTPTETKNRCFYKTYASRTNEFTNANLSGYGAKSYISKFSAKFILNGPQEGPTKWCIQLVQLSEEVVPGVETELATAFWQACAKPYGFSPLEAGPSRGLRKHLKVLKSFYCAMDTPESSEDHVTSRMRQVDFDGHLNRTCNYRWDYAVDKVGMTEADIPEDDDVGTEVNSTHVHPNARVYIMVRAMSKFTPLESWSQQKHPSYDIKLDVTHCSLDSK
jgi:hypothetical protein